MSRGTIRHISKTNFLTKLQKQERIDYVYSLINASYVPLFNNNDIVTIYLSALQELLTFYDNKNSSGFNYKKIRANPPVILYPKINEILNCFTYTVFENIKVIFLLDYPLPTTLYNGIPLLTDISNPYDYRGVITVRDIFKLNLFENKLEILEVLREIPINHLFVNDEKILTIEKILHSRYKITSSEIEMLEPFSYKESQMFNVRDWMDQGVLPVFLSLTNNSENEYNDHMIVWSNFIEQMLLNFCMLNRNLIIVTFGYEATQTVKSLNLDLLLNNNLTIFNEPELTLNNLNLLSNDSVFGKINTDLSSKNLNVINWIKPVL